MISAIIMACREGFASGPLPSFLAELVVKTPPAGLDHWMVHYSTKRFLCLNA